MPKIENNHDSEVSLQDHPQLRVGLERIGKGIALVMNNIRLSRQSQINIFQEVIDPHETMTFDYVNLATDEIDPKTRAKKKLISELISKFGYAYYLKQKLIDIFRSPENKVISNYLRTKLNDSLEKENEPWFLNAETQHRDIDEKILSNLYTDRNSNAAKLVQGAIKRDINKPFLVIHGHGGSRTTEQNEGAEWYIGEQTTSLDVSLTEVFDHLEIESGKYSAVLLLACNEAEHLPPLTDTPVIFVKGLAGPGIHTLGKIVSEWYRLKT